ncbi:methyltransferase, putative [Plasmodium gallinaceum]|uniref:Methyltransferase, putative n=1 Tax=Plasmodium gallinaceum TaxID=5849 RepID=A0A1J1GZU6_PLAGA|nr:methyltransferase, putative [Plasmodium gallinaceum]CRG98142.1 methyltransferase, putative [Plasmodium gallinaceum]
MFTFSSFKKLLLGVTVANGSVILGCFYIYKKNRPLNVMLDEPTENFRIKIFDALAKNYDEKNDFIEKITSINKYKKKNFRKARGVVLEIGAGSGRNFAYLNKIDILICVEKSENMCKELKKKVEKIKPPYPVYIINNDIKNNIFKPEVFDSVISSFTLCSLEYLDESLKNIYQALKNNGKFYLVERGIIYNKFIRYILEKLNLYPNYKMPWEYGYYENRYPLEILKKNDFSIIFKLVKNAGSVYILIAKKYISSDMNSGINNDQKVKKINSEVQDKINNNIHMKERNIDINNIISDPQKVPIYYYYKNDI